MIRDFFLLLIVVTGIELGVRFAVVLYEFEHHDKEMVDLTANRLASDLRSIMLNSGGPVAARTIYPILKRNYQDLGMTVAIVPSAVTVSSMQSMFQFTPQEISPAWPPGKYNESRVALMAEQFCLGCHVQAKVGDELGYVTVRNNLSTRGWLPTGVVSVAGAPTIIANIAAPHAIPCILSRVRETDRA